MTDDEFFNYLLCSCGISSVRHIRLLRLFHTPLLLHGFRIASLGDVIVDVDIAEVESPPVYPGEPNEDGGADAPIVEGVDWFSSQEDSASQYCAADILGSGNVEDDVLALYLGDDDDDVDALRICFGDMFAVSALPIRRPNFENALR